jgi:hypothetical protein
MNSKLEEFHINPIEEKKINNSLSESKGKKY